MNHSCRWMRGCRARIPSWASRPCSLMCSTLPPGSSFQMIMVRPARKRTRMAQASERRQKSPRQRGLL
jgi:hypothetical protein